MTNVCNKCGGELIGDGYSMVIHCENAEDTEYEFAAPDEGPFECNYKEEGESMNES